MEGKTIDLNHLTTACSLSPARCSSFAEAAAVCLEVSGHVPGVKLRLEGDLSATFALL